MKSVTTAVRRSYLRQALVPVAALMVLMQGSGISVAYPEGGDLVFNLPADETHYYRVHVFTNTVESVFAVGTGGGDVEFLVVGGGGGGGGGPSTGTVGDGGGGGAGGLVFASGFLGAGNYPVVVGAGGAGGYGDAGGTSGSNSTFNGFLARGGGGGGSQVVAPAPGGSGGGSGQDPDYATAGSNAATQPGTNPTAVTDAGNPGGLVSVNQQTGGGGGGAGSPGKDNTNTPNRTGADGGAGLDFSLVFGDSVGAGGWFAGGGGGAGRNTSGGLGGGAGAAGGGHGGTGGANGTNAMHGTGSGGGGGSQDGGPSHGGAGGSGIVIIRYLQASDEPLSVTADPATGIGTSVATLNGWVGGFGGEESPAIYFCWGPEDGQTVGTGNWFRVEFLGDSWTPGASFSLELSDLTPYREYSFRVYATNSTGAVWSDVRTFQTQPRTRTWTGAAGADWFEDDHWQDNDLNPGVPETDDAVVIPAGSTLLLTNATAELASFSITNATLTFSNWTACLRATQVDVWSNGILTHAIVNTNDAPGITNRVYVTGSNLTVRPGGRITASARGHWRSLLVNSTPGAGPGAGTSVNGYGGGGGYGGKGGNGGTGIGGPDYGSEILPLEPGSQGGNMNNTDPKQPGGAGGGLVVLEMDGTVTLESNGLIVANGGSNGNATGRGSGGGIVICCNALAVSGADQIRANGGNVGSGANGGKGGGGRIAVLPFSRAWLPLLMDGDMKRFEVAPPPDEMAAYFSVVASTDGAGSADPGSVRFVYYIKPPGSLFMFH